MSTLHLRIDPLPPIPASLPGDPITGNTGGSSGGGQAGSSLQLSYYLYDHCGNLNSWWHAVKRYNASENQGSYVQKVFNYWNNSFFSKNSTYYEE